MTPVPLRGPEFGSYAADEVAWLLTDLSRVSLESPVHEREARIQSGLAHYSESLPVEYQPSEEYQRLYRDALNVGATRVALAVGTVSEVLAARHPEIVLASLARAGTPVGILIRRWLQRFHDRHAPHYAVSIIRDRGIDTVALEYLARHHDSRNVVFIDGWTGKGAIARELAAAIPRSNVLLGTDFTSELAVLADPGHCVRTYGTRDDFLVPSACLNSTVSGLVSRTVLNAVHTGPGDFHGAKYYAGLRPQDVSNDFLDTVEAAFGEVRERAVTSAATMADLDTAPTWAGWSWIETLGRRYGVDDMNLIKPGVGETTRVLLRRVPWRILVSPDSEADLVHVRALAEERGVPIEVVPGMPYSCVGLIRPAGTS